MCTHERACLPSLLGTPNARSYALFLLHHQGGGQRGTLPMPPAFLYAEAWPATPFAPRYRQARFRARSSTRRRLCGTWSMSGTTAPVRENNAPPLGRASLLPGMTTRHLTSQRDGTGHHLSPPAVQPNWAERPMQRLPRPALRQSSAAVTSPAPAQLVQRLDLNQS